jgi:hypothetical protein
MATNNAVNFPTGATGTVLLGQGLGTAPIYSTATFPTTAGSSGNVLTSDGTNWSSSAPAGGGVSSVTGTANRITSSGGATPVIDISASYVGQSSITTLGTIASGTWNGSVIGLAYGGTNANLTASNGGIFYSTATAGAVLAGTATAGQVLRSGASTTPAWSTATYPATAGTSGNVLASDGTNFASTAPVSVSQSYPWYSTLASPLDGTTYYTQSASTWITTINAISRLWIPKTGTIKSCYGGFSVSGTLGTTENITIAIRLNDTTNTNVTTTLTAASSLNLFSNAGLSIAVSAGDYVTFMVITPSWATNPTSVTLNLSIFIT